MASDHFFWLISVLIVLPRIQYFSLGLAALATNIIFLLVPLIILIYISLERKWRDRERQASNEREIERQSFISQIFKAQENERQKIARELHDGPTQTLLVLATRANDLNSCDTRNNSSNLREQAQWIKDMALSVSEELRRLSLDLRPGMLDNLGLIPALRWLAKNLTQDGIDTSVEIKGEVVRLPSEVDINIFRIVQEALNNIRKHSKATSACLTVEFNDHSVQVVIQDNGIGFSPESSSRLNAMGKLGLLGIQQRVSSLHGNFSLRSEPRKGTVISIEVKP